MSAREQTETLAAEVLVAFRRLGYNRVHFALVMPDTIADATHWGAPCRVIASPVSAFCNRTLRGSLVEIPSEYLDGWRKQGHVCSECVWTARLALERAS